MFCNNFLLTIKSELKSQKIAIYCFPIPCLVPKSQGSGVVRIKGINGKKIRQKSVRIDKICDVIMFPF